MRRLAAATRQTAPALLLAAIGAGISLVASGGGWWGMLIAAAILAFALWHWAGVAAGRVSGWFVRVAPDRRVSAWDGQVAAIADKPTLTNADYDLLVGYFAAGVMAYRSPGCALVTYPGVPGTRGLRVEGLEGFARTAPLLAAWVCRRGDIIPLPDGTRFDAFDHLIRGFRSGLDAASPEYWGRICDLDQRIVEAGDIALVAWLLRERLRAALPSATQAGLMDWLGEATQRRIYGGNWHLFCAMAGLVREAWGMPRDAAARRHYAEFKKCYVGGGWFSDGVNGNIDFYNAWQMHYFLPLMDRVDPDLDRDFIRGALRDFADSFIYFFTRDGFPMFGRSACYRMALPAPLVFASGLDSDPFPAGLARHALDAVWSHFIRRGGVAAGQVTQGYEGPQPDLLENYSGRGSCHWALRSLVAAYLQSPEEAIWRAAPEPFPVEVGSFDMLVADGRLRVVGDRATGVVEVFPQRDGLLDSAPYHPQTTIWRIAEMLLGRPFRPANHAAKYRRRSYRSDTPFCRTGTRNGG